MNNETYTLSEPMTTAIVIWLVGHDHKDPAGTLKLSTLVQCFRDLGILRSSPRRIWRALKHTSIPATFPFCEVAENAFCVLLVCHPSAHWLDTTTAWIEANRPLLIEKQALNPDAPNLMAVQHDAL